MRSALRYWVLSFVAGSVTSAALAQEALQHAERIEDSYLPAAQPVVFSLPATSGFATRGFPRSVQVNVSTAGLNIVSDAANEPSIAIDPRAPLRMVVGYRQFDNIASNFRQAGYSYSRDGGRTWTQGMVEQGIFRSDPVLRAFPVDVESGAIVWNMLTVNDGQYITDIYKSSDGGATWVGPTSAPTGDKMWFTIDRTTGPRRGNIYQVWSTAANPQAPNQYNYSATRGQTWTGLSQLPTSPIWGTCAVGVNGEVMTASANGMARIVIATDPTPSTGQAQFVARVVGAGPSGQGIGAAMNPAGLAGQTCVEVDRSQGPRRGCVYLLWTGSAIGGSDVAFSRSCDNGLTWSSPYIFPAVSPGAANRAQWFGTMGIAPNGRLDVFYLDTSVANNLTLSALFYSSSQDGGVTWTTPEQMGPTFSSVVGWPNQQKMGDYYDIESYNLGATLAYCATYNNEQDVYVLRVGSEDCDRNDIADEVQIASNVQLDCNSNGLLDACEIAANSQLDANGNGRLDSCEPVCDGIDFNRDGLFPDDQDLVDFLRVLSGGPCSTPACNDIDFNNDGLLPDDNDLVAYLRVLAGGAC